MTIKSSFLLRAAITTVLTCACLTAFAANLPQHARQRGRLDVGVRYVVPAYVAGAKYRTPESIDSILAENLAARLQVTLATLHATTANRMELLASGKADVLLAAVAGSDTLSQAAAVVPTGYTAAPLAIMRTDTDIKEPQQFKGRTVCLSEGGTYVGTMAARYGAIEKVYKAPADALLALRIGGCDAAVHDDAMLTELLKLPEWKKFSTRLTVGPRSALVLVAPAGDIDAAAFLKKTVHAWSDGGYLAKIRKKWANDVAFEVYLSQSVPDCH